MNLINIIFISIIMFVLGVILWVVSDAIYRVKRNIRKEELETRIKAEIIAQREKDKKEGLY